MGALEGVLEFNRRVGASVVRQFDDTEGGGIADEAGAVLDPTRAASAQTESDLRTASMLGGPFTAPVFQGTLLSDVADDVDPNNAPPPGAGRDNFLPDLEVVPDIELPDLPELPDLGGLAAKALLVAALLVGTIVAVGAFAKGAGEGVTS